MPPVTAAPSLGAKPSLDAILRDRSLLSALGTLVLLSFALFGPLSTQLVDLLYHPSLAAWMPDAICFHKPSN